MSGTPGMLPIHSVDLLEEFIRGVSRDTGIELVPDFDERMAEVRRMCDELVFVDIPGVSGKGPGIILRGAREVFRDEVTDYRVAEALGFGEGPETRYSSTLARGDEGECRDDIFIASTIVTGASES